MIHTDGSASVKDKTGGWGFVATFAGMTAHRSGYACPTTISVMEILAINRALHFLTPTDLPVRIYSDSKYAVNSLTEWGPIWRCEGWLTSTGKPVSNSELIDVTMQILDRHRSMREISIEWIKGHSGIHGNEVADGLAGKARRAGKGSWQSELDYKFTRLADALILPHQEAPTPSTNGKHHKTPDVVQRPRFRTPL